MNTLFPLLSFDENEVRILPVLMYHAPNKDTLEEQFQWLRDNQYTSVHLNEILNYFINPKTTSYPIKTVVLTFDDAYQNFHSIVCPLLKNFDFKATLCVPTGEIPIQEENRKQPPIWTNGKGPLMTWDEIRNARSFKTEKGEDLIEFIPHSVTHRYFNELEQLDNPEEEFRKEVKDSKERLSVELEITIDSIKLYCLPGGIGEGKDIVERVLHDENYIGALRAQYKKGDKWNRYRIPRCEPNNKNDLIKLLLTNDFCCE